MSPPLLRPFLLVNDIVLSGASGDNTYRSDPLDLRRSSRVEGVMVMGNDFSASQPNFDVGFEQGVTAVRFGDDADRFTTYNAATDKLLASVGVETWQAVAMPTFILPFVRFVIVSKAGSPVTSTYFLYAYVRESFE